MPTLIPAAQYLRVSTESQAYSLENQSIAIAEWATLHGFQIVKTYSDPGKSGIVLKHRVLADLLSDVASKRAEYKAVLVYDVSRWGRFQDMDEAAHYEYLCKQAGIPVYYCAEAFSAESTMPNLILKALKRTMAAEYSRDLGERTYFRQRKSAEQGFWVGSSPGYGFRRLLFDTDGKIKHLLKFGEAKSVSSDRVKITFGPKNELACVRRIFDMVIRSDGKVRLTEIAKELNRREIKYFGKPWDAQRVKRILTSRKYCGEFVWGKTARKLHGALRRTNSAEWVRANNVVPAIVSRAVFEKVQALRRSPRHTLSREIVLERCAEALRREGRLSLPLLSQTAGGPCNATIYKYFGDVWSLYRELHYQPEDSRVLRESGRHLTTKLRNEMLNRVAALCPLHIDVIEPAPHLRRLLLIDGVLQVSVLICRCYEPGGWVVMPHKRERELMTLLCLMNVDNNEVTQFYLAQHFPLRAPFHEFHLNSRWLRNFTEITDLKNLYWTAWELQGENPIGCSGRPAQRYDAYWVPETVSPRRA